MSNKYKELGKNSAWTFLGNVGGKVIALLMLPFYTSILSVADYGVLDMLTCYSVTLYDVITLCIAQAIFVFPKDANEGDKIKYFTAGLIYSAITAIVIGAIINLAVNLIVPDSNVFRHYYYLIFAMSTISFLHFFLQNFIRSVGKMNIYGFIGIIYTGAVAAFSFIFMPYYGLNGYIAAMILAGITASVYTFVAGNLWRFFILQNNSWAKYKEMLLYSAPLVVNVLISFGTNYLNRPFMEQYQTLENVGLFSVASKFPSIISTLVPVFCLALQISVMEEFGKKDYQRFYNNIFRLTTVILMCGSLILVLSGKFLIGLFTTQEYVDAWKYMPILLLGTIFNYWGYFSGTNFTAVRKSKYFLYTGVATMIVSVVLNYVLIRNYGLVGTCFASMLTALGFSISRFAFSWQYAKIEKMHIYVTQIALFIFESILCVYWGINIFSIIVGISVIALILFSNKELMPLLIKQIKQ